MQSIVTTYSKIQYVADFHLRIAKVAQSGIASAAKRDRPDVTFLARQRFRTHHYGDRIEAFSRLTPRDTIIGGTGPQASIWRC